MKIYTKHGDDGTTGLLFGGRVRKDDPAPIAYGDVDEAQAAIGAARAEAAAAEHAELHEILTGLARDLWIVMAELATAPENRHKLDSSNLVSAEMVKALEVRIDDITSRFEMPKEFVVPGQNRVSASLDLSRTVVRRAERSSLAVAADGSEVVPYLNRLSDLMWALARWQDGAWLATRDT